MMKQRNSPPIEFNSRKIEKKSHKLELHFEKRKEKNWNQQETSVL